jgi:hypothetical protein
VTNEQRKIYNAACVRGYAEGRSVIWNVIANTEDEDEMRRLALQNADGAWSKSWSITRLRRAARQTSQMYAREAKIHLRDAATRQKRS